MSTCQCVSGTDFKHCWATSLGTASIYPQNQSFTNLAVSQESSAPTVICSQTLVKLPGVSSCTNRTFLSLVLEPRPEILHLPWISSAYGLNKTCRASVFIVNAKTVMRKGNSDSSWSELSGLVSVMP